LPTESFDAQSLSCTIPAVPRTSSCFLVCHTLPPTPCDAVSPPFIGGGSKHPFGVGSKCRRYVIGSNFHYDNEISLTFRYV
jgi:hypothetical protein